MVLLRRGDHEDAVALFEQGAALGREAGGRGLANNLTGAGDAALRRGDFSLGISHYRDALAIFERYQDQWGIAGTLERLGMAAGQGEDSVRCACLLSAAQRLREAIEVPMDSAQRARHERTLADAARALGEEAFAEAWARGRGMDLAELVGRILEGDDVW
jgi:hypothetical protein